MLKSMPFFMVALHCLCTVLCFRLAAGLLWWVGGFSLSYLIGRIVCVLLVSDRSSFFDGEFDPGSGRTLAACLTHASRTDHQDFGFGGEWRTGE